MPEHNPVTRINKLNNCNNNLPATKKKIKEFLVFFLFGCQIQRQNFFSQFSVLFFGIFAKNTERNDQQQKHKKNQKNNLGIQQQQQQINQQAPNLKTVDFVI